MCMRLECVECRGTQEVNIQVSVTVSVFVELEPPCVELKFSSDALTLESWLYSSLILAENFPIEKPALPLIVVELLAFCVSSARSSLTAFSSYVTV